MDLRPWATAFVFTQAVEVPIYVSALRDGKPITWRHVAIAFGASTLTHPIVWFIFPRIGIGSYWAVVAEAEAFAVVVEAVWLAAFRLERPLLWSVVANAASAGLGLTLRALFGWP